MSKGNILIVEDDIQLLPVFKAVLKNDGYKVTLAETGEKAVKLLKVNEYDLILSDIVLGGVDGIEVLKAAKEQNPDTAVIMITGYSSTESAVDALREGADDYIQKPSSNDELLVRIERAMEKTRLKMELKIAEDRYSNIIKTSMDGYYMVDNRGDFLDANDSFCKMIGYDRNELLKMKIADIEAIESPDDVKKHIEKIIKKGYDSFESKHKCKSGNVINVEISANYTEDNGGKIYSFARDITKRKETERELKKSEEKYHDVFEKMGYGVAVYEAVEGGRDFIFKDLNKAGEKISKVKKKDIISRTVTEYFPGVKKLGLFNTLQNVWKTGKARYIPDSLYEDDRLKLWVDNSVFKIHSGEIVAVYRDITEGKKAEVALKENELKYRTLVDTIPDVVYRIDPDGKFTYLNDSVKFLGYKPGDLIGKHYKEILHPGDYKRFSSEFALPELRGKKIGKKKTPKLIDERRTGKRLSKDIIARLVPRGSKNGNGHYTGNISCSGVYSSDVLEGTIGVIKNITEMVEFENALKESEELHRITLTNITDAVFITKNNGDFTYICGNVKFIFGFTKDEVEKLGKINSLLGKGLFKKKDLNDKGEIQNIERTVKDKKGKEHHVLVNVKKVNIKGGTILYSCRDITERKKTENALVESEQKHRSLFETMIQGVVYQNVDGAITSANSAAERILGLSIDQMQGRASIDPRWKAIHEDGSDFSGKTHPSMLSLRSGKEIRNVVMGVFNPESNAHCWINVNAVPQFKKGKSKPFQVYTTFEDITERRKIQELIVEKEKYYRSLLYNLHEDIIVIDENYNITDLNNTFMNTSGFDRDDIVGKHCFEISHGYDKPCDKYGNECYIKEVFKTGTPYHCQHEHIHKNGKKKHVDILFSPIFDEKGEIIHVIESIRDISELMDTQTALSLSEEKFRTLTGNLNVGVFRTTPDKIGRFLEANPALVKMFGFDNREEMMKVNIADYYDDPKERAVFSRKATRKGKVENEVFLFKKKNGETIVGSISALAIKDENGKTTHFDGIIEDITDRKKAEFQLQWDLKVIKAMAEISGRLIRKIENIEDITELVLKHSRQVTNSKHGFVSMIDPENGDNIAYTLTEMMKKSCKLKPEDQHIRFPIGPDGRYPKLWGYSLNTKKTFYTNDPDEHKASGGIPEGHVLLENFLSVPVMLGNELVGQIAIANSGKGFSDDDVAAVERIAELYAIAIQNIRIEEARQNSEQRYRAIYENTGIGMGILDKSGKLLDFNAIFAELFKFNSKSKNDIFLENLFDFGQKEEIKRLFGFLLSGRMKKIQTKSQMITAENTAFWGRVTIFNIITSSTSIDLLIIMIEDISDQRKAEVLEKQHQVQLVQTHKLAALGEVVAGVAHEINNPNSFISFNIPILKELWRNFEPKLLEYSKTHPEWKVKGKIIDVWVENFHEIIKHIEIGSDRINKIVSSLKDYTRKEDSGFDKQVRIKEVIEKSMVIVGAQARRIVSSVKLNIDDDLPQITGNPQKLEQVLTNLIMNSTNAVPEKSKGKLMITAKHCRHLNAVLIEIEDNGIGIAPENMDRVSEPFFTTRRDKGGTGLGLSVSYNIIKEHGGNLDIFSRTGIGTRMTVHLPVDKRKKLNIKPTILCVDDDEMVLKSLKSIFLRFENRFVEATSKPENVIEYLNEHPEIYLIISDVHMPVMDGYELLIAVKRKFPLITMILFSGDHIVSEEIESLKIKPDYYLHKPFKFKELLPIIDSTKRFII